MQGKLYVILVEFCKNRWSFSLL